MPILRKIIFYIFLAIYLTVCPLLILRMLGFVWDPQTRQFVKTGIIYASSNPPAATIFINDQKAKETTPAIIRDLPPDTYHVRFELHGYQAWKNTMPVVARKATVLENILLIPDQWQIKTLSPLSFDHLLPLGDGNALFVWQEKEVKDLYLLKLNKDTSVDNPIEPEPSNLTPVFPEESIYAQGQILRFFTVPKSPFVIAQIQMADKSKYLWIDVRDKQIHIEDLSDLMPEEPIKLWWEPNDERNLYAFYNDHTNRMDIKTKALFPNIPSKDIPFHKIKLIGPSEKSIPDEDNMTWIEFNEQKIGLWDRSLKKTQWIHQKGKQISQVFWANKDNTIIFKDNSKVFLLDKTTFGQIRLQKILETQPNTSIHYSEKTGKLYFIETKKHQLSSIVILRHKPILPKSIADTLRLKEYEP